jgi:archaeal chaperonin
MNGQQPIIVLNEDTRREKGNDAQENNITAAISIADAIKSTLGPKGMDKMLIDSMGDVVITNDGATILKEVDIEHPAAKMIVEVAKSQDEECGDGTTTAVVLTGELLKQARNLLEKKIHPTLINKGYKLASIESIKHLKTLVKDLDDDTEKVLFDIAKTSMASKNASSEQDFLSDIVVKAIMMIATKEDSKYKVDLDNIHVVKVNGSGIKTTELLNGVVVDKERVSSDMPKSIKNAKIALLNSPIEVKKTNIEANIEIRDPNQLQAFLDEEEGMLKKLVTSIENSGANVVFCNKGVDDVAQYYLSKAGIYTVRRVSKSTMERLAKSTGGKLVNNIIELKESDLGNSELVEERKLADDKMTFVTGCKNPKSVSIILRGSTEHITDELERAMHDALSVVGVALEDGKVVAGGGAVPIDIAMHLREYAPSIGGREQMAIEAFAEALEVIPKTLAENAGMDPVDVVIGLRNEHSKGNKYHGINLHTGNIINTLNSSIIEPYRVPYSEIEASSEAASMILRIDDIIASKKADIPQQPQGGGMPPGMM